MTPASGELLIWPAVEIRTFAHEVATAASELREIAPLLRALCALRVPADRARRLGDELATVTRAAEHLQAVLQRDARDLWAAADASGEMEQDVTAILTQRPATRAAEDSKRTAPHGPTTKRGGP